MDVPCPKCKKSINASATRCRYCQGDLTDAEMRSMRAESSNLNRTAGFGCLGLVGVVGLIGFCAPAEKSPYSDEPKIAAAQFEKAVMSPVETCNAAAMVALDNLGRVDKGLMSRADAYGLISTGKATCDQARDSLSLIQFPDGLPEAADEPLRAAKTNCWAASQGRSDALGIMLRLLDGDTKASTLNELTVKSEEVKRDSLRCRGQLHFGKNQTGDVKAATTPK